MIVGRLGHGLGSDLTEWPSNTATDDTVLEVGMIMTLEPGMSYLNKSGQVKQMGHEEKYCYQPKRAPNGYRLGRPQNCHY